MDRAEPGVGTAPQATAGPCRAAMHRPRERTMKELLRHAQKISEPRVCFALDTEHFYRPLQV